VTTIEACVHHWLLEEGNRNVPGRCRKCGEARVFAGEPDYRMIETTGGRPGPNPPSAAQRQLAAARRTKAAQAAAKRWYAERREAMA